MLNIIISCVNIIFVVLNFRSIYIAHQIFNDHCVKNGDIRTSCCYAMVTDIPTKRSSGLYLLYGPRFFPSASAHLSIRALPDSLRQYLAKERRVTEIFWDQGVHLRA